MNRAARHIAWLVALALLACTPASAPVDDLQERATVVLLHGLNRSHRSMGDLARAVEAAGFRAVNLDYPSGRHPVAELTRRVRAALERCCAAELRTGLDFVTHSLGGILVRDLRARYPELAIQRVVMLSPPNRGSELVDVLRASALFRIVTGPAGQELGTGPDSVPNRLGPVDFPLGVVAGSGSLNPVYSWLIPGTDDGTVAVNRAAVEGMADFVVVDASHTFIMHDREAIRQAVHFLRHGRFDRPR